ncbi:hypothetical protein [Yoonia litorea]|uniref:Uncharacterized protein n=1 Tax=Yoonia litorea TaxID=1123755 RepID=A0A1I6N2T8_9RHOB|nr:hypothetical protein [Yoonia litorea]SFS22263.1 hypothetical protein SAMN05444714_3228 [Yoonia litorea]
MASTKEEKQLATEQLLKPSEFMRLRRPEQFSDTVVTSEPYLDQVYFEYHLETLTSRGEEKVFEHFARKICEAVICPNLIPQTGPTGGGDSKVDTENIPVSSDISERWFYGEDSASERWGFAFSAKKAWQPKCKSDVQKIAKTKRGYKCVFFVSNQFVPDRKRAELEDELTKKHGFSVRVLDRSWLVEAVFEKGYEDLAIETLQLSIAMQSNKKVGIGDQQKRTELEALEKRIQAVKGEGEIDFQLMDDCLHAAILSRELEEPREFTDGRFDRARRMAAKAGNNRQILAAIYQHAWTAAYWHDDPDTSSKLYDEIEKRSLASDRVEDVECAVNIWQTMLSLIRHGSTKRDTEFDERTKRLLAHLETVANDAQRPNNAANAKGMLLLMRISLDQEDDDLLTQYINEFRALFEDARRLGGFQFHRFREIFEILGDAIGELPAYDVAFETVLSIVEQRSSETAAGDQLFRRGVQKIEAGHLYDAIRYLGRAMARFTKHESQLRLEACLAGLAHAYSKAGLYWAAYCAYVSLLSMLMGRFEKDRDVKTGIYRVCVELTLNCLRTGNVPSFLFFFHLEKVFETYIEKEANSEGESKSKDRLDDRDGYLATLLLDATDEQKDTLAYLPVLFEGLGLTTSAMIVYLMHQGQAGLREEGFLPDGVSDEDVWEMIAQMAKQPVRSEMAGFLELRDLAKVTMKSNCLGVQWEIEATNSTTVVRVAQSFVGFIESALSTSLNADIMPTTSTIRLEFVDAKESHSANGQMISFQEDDSNDFFEVAVDPEKFEGSSEYMTVMRDAFVELFAHLVGTYMTTHDPEAYLDRVVGSEEGFRRALIFNDMVTTATNVFSEESEETLGTYIESNEPIAKTASAGFKAKFKLVSKSVSPMPPAEMDRKEIEFGEGEIPTELLEPTNTAHRQRRVVSPINVRKWDRAKWSGCGFLSAPGFPPVFGLIFTNEQAALSIFEEWRNKFGKEDVHDDIRVSIVGQLSHRDPHGYGVTVGGNFENADMREQESAVMISRINFMEHPNPQSLAVFLAAYGELGGYILAPIVANSDLSDGKFMPELGLRKRHLKVRSAWEIGEHDPDCVVLKPDHDPIIPSDVQNPPVVKAMARVRSRRRSVNPNGGLNRAGRRREKAKGKRKKKRT